MTDVRKSSYEWTTVFVIRHSAGSQEGAIHQRNEFDRAVVELGGETVMAWTDAEGDAMARGYRVFSQLANEEPGE